MKKKFCILALLLAILVLSGSVMAAEPNVNAVSCGYNNSWDQNVTFSNGYVGFCLDGKKKATSTEYAMTAEDRMTAVITDDVALKLKLLFILNFDTIFKADGNGGYLIKDSTVENNVLAVIRYLCGEASYVSGNANTIGSQRQMATAVENYIAGNKNLSVADSGYSLKLDETKSVVFDFMVISPTTKASDGREIQPYFAFKIREVKTEPAHECDFKDTWSHDATNHWKECKDAECSKIAEESTHEGGEATCKKGAVCSTCEREYTAVNAKNHKGQTELRGAKEATTEAPGYTGDTYCLGCETKIRDGKDIPQLHKCDFTGGWEFNEREHWKKCTSDTCDETSEPVAHTGGEPPTCSAWSVCKICANPYGELDADNHAGGTEVLDAKPATVEEDGYTGDTYCLGCKEMIEKGEVIPKLASGDVTGPDGSSPEGTAPEEPSDNTDKVTPTGDDTNMMLYFAALVLAGLVAGGTLLHRRRTN